MPLADISISCSLKARCLLNMIRNGVVAVVGTSHRSIPRIMREEGTKIHMLTTASANHLTGHLAGVEDFTYILSLRFMADTGGTIGEVG